MVKHIVEVAQILLLPDLEAETKATINAYIRDGLKEQPSVNKSPPQLNDDIVSEWLHGSGGDKA